MSKKHSDSIFKTPSFWGCSVSFLFLMGLLLHSCEAACRKSLSKDWYKQNDASFHKILADTQGTIVAKRALDKTGRFYLDTDKNPKTIEAVMDVPFPSLKQEVAFQEKQVGSSSSLLDLKKQFQPAKVDLTKPASYVGVRFLNTQKTK
jgi:hypothetical protein